MDVELVRYEVSKISRKGSKFQFTITMVFSDDTRYTIACHEVFTHQSIEMFRYHHREMVQFYTSLEIS